VLAHGDSVVSAQAVTNRTAVLTGGGLSASKTVSVGGLPTDWATASAEDQSTAAQIAARGRERAERQLWRVWVPLVLAAFAVACAFGARSRVDQEGKAIHGEANRQGQVPVS
jgi:high-affinity iron transporter